MRVALQEIIDKLDSIHAEMPGILREAAPESDRTFNAIWDLHGKIGEALRGLIAVERDISNGPPVADAAVEQPSEKACSVFDDYNRLVAEARVRGHQDQIEAIKWQTRLSRAFGL